MHLITLAVIYLCAAAARPPQTADVIKCHLLKSEPLKACRRCPHQLKGSKDALQWEVLTCGRCEWFSVFLQMSSRGRLDLATANQIHLAFTIRQEHGGEEHSISNTVISTSYQALASKNNAEKHSAEEMNCFTVRQGGKTVQLELSV